MVATYPKRPVFHGDHCHYIHKFRGGIASRNINESYDIYLFFAFPDIKGKILKSTNCFLILMDFYRFFHVFPMDFEQNPGIFSTSPSWRSPAPQWESAGLPRLHWWPPTPRPGRFFGGHHHGTLRESWIIWLDTYVYIYYIYIYVCIYLSVCLSIYLI